MGFVSGVTKDKDAKTAADASATNQQDKMQQMQKLRSAQDAMAPGKSTAQAGNDIKANQRDAQNQQLGKLKDAKNSGAATGDSNYGYNAGDHTAERITPGEQSTVSGQMNQLLDNNSKYMQDARLRAREQSNSRGLVNSSIAARAGERAAIESAMPIAQQDASTFFDSQKLNQDATNRFRENTQAFDIKKSLSNQDQTFTVDNKNLDQSHTLEQKNVDQGHTLEQKSVDQGYTERNKSLDQANTLQQKQVDQQYTVANKNLDQHNTIQLKNLDQKNTVATEKLRNNLAMAKDKNSAQLQAWLDDVQTSNKLDLEQKMSFTNAMTGIMTQAQVDMDAVGTATHGKYNSLISPEQQAHATQQIINQRDAQVSMLRDMYLSGDDLDFDIPEYTTQRTATA